jgi:hypothetical protein
MLIPHFHCRTAVCCDGKWHRQPVCNKQQPIRILTHLLLAGGPLQGVSAGDFSDQAFDSPPRFSADLSTLASVFPNFLLLLLTNTLIGSFGIYLQLLLLFLRLGTAL